MTADQSPFTVNDLLEKLLTIDGNLPVAGTKRGNSLRVDIPGTKRFGYVFLNRGKDTMWLTDRSEENHQEERGYLMSTSGSDLLSRSLLWLMAHPDSSAKTIANAMSVQDDRLVYGLLRKAEERGECQRWRTGKGTWLWQATL